MKNLPIFTTEYGVASLTLDQIPYTRSAYITLQDSQQPEELLDACVSFCKAVGAEYIYACNHEYLTKYPVYTDIVEMRIEKAMLPSSTLSIVPVTVDTAEHFCKIYNEKMQNVKTAGYMTKRMVEEEKAYYIHNENVIMGIGIVRENTLSAVASLHKGAGRDVLSALCQEIGNDVVRLEVASENKKAVSLYSALGFQETRICNTWYKII